MHATGFALKPTPTSIPYAMPAHAKHNLLSHLEHGVHAAVMQVVGVFAPWVLNTSAGSINPAVAGLAPSSGSHGAIGLRPASFLANTPKRSGKMPGNKVEKKTRAGAVPELQTLPQVQPAVQPAEHLEARPHAANPAVTNGLAAPSSEKLPVLVLKPNLKVRGTSDEVCRQLAVMEAAETLFKHKKTLAVCPVQA